VSVNSEHQVILSPDPFEQSRDNSYTGFSKYNSHGHIVSYPNDPRYLEIYEGDFVYALTEQGDLVFPENTVVNSIDEDTVYTSSPSNHTVSEAIIHLLLAPQDSLEDSRKLYRASIDSGSSQIELGAIPTGFVKESWIKDSSRMMISGDFILSGTVGLTLIPSEIFPAFRILNYQFSVVSLFDSTLGGNVDVELRGLNQGGSSYRLVSPKRLDTNNNFLVKELNIDEGNEIVPEQRGLAINITQNTLSANNEQIIDLGTLNSLNELVTQGLSSSSARLQYWIDITRLKVSS